MNLLESYAIRVRHSRYLKHARFWDLVRPLYNFFLACVTPKGLTRVINGSDRMLISSKFRGVSESYEPRVWEYLMRHVRPNDRIVDVGAFIGLYAVALGKRLGPSGQVFAFEPEENNYQALCEHVQLNGLAEKVRPIRAAVSSSCGRIAFVSKSCESHVSLSPAANDSLTNIECVTLDSVFPKEALDIMKIDVEGYEESVLKGASKLLSDVQRRPRLLCVEVHPFAWAEAGTTSESLISLLEGAGYSITDLEGNIVKKIDAYSEIFANLKDGQEANEKI